MHNILDERKLKFFEIVDTWLEENKGDKELFRAVAKRDCILSIVVLDAAINANEKEYVNMARKRILKHRRTVLLSKNFSLKFKLGTVVLWLCPNLYYKMKK